MSRNIVIGLILLCVIVLSWQFNNLVFEDASFSPAVVELDPVRKHEPSPGALIDEPLQPVTHPRFLRDDKVVLGRMLFSDKRLSPNGDISCDSCHRLDQGGSDNRSHPVGGDSSRGVVNTPTIFNSANNFKWYWDGRAASLEEQVDESLTSSTELGADWPTLLHTLRGVPEYQSAFSEIYPASDEIQSADVIDAIAEFERSLVTSDTPFDHYLMGQSGAITSDEERGYHLFKSYGCIACHQGGNVGGNMFQLFGVMGDFFAEREPVMEVDLGRFNITAREDDRHRFRVPSLRNVALTAPYFHDGSVQTLEQAVMVMANYQLGRPIPVADANLIVKFLHTLSGNVKEGRVGSEDD